jgi:PncC family amidohydrolase
VADPLMQPRVSENGCDVRDRFARAIRSRRLSVGVAESMTGGALAEALVTIPGSGDWLAGGVISYFTRVKRDVLGVSPGPVISESAARDMARGSARVLGTDVGISTTGCAGPDEMEGQPVGSAWIAVAVRDRTTARHFQFEGEPAEVRTQAVEAAIVLAIEAIAAAD